MKESEPVPAGIYVRNYIALMLLLVATATAARFNLGAGNTVAALGIGAAKAILVVLYFMHVRFGKPLIMLASAAGFFWLLILFTLSLSDFLSRGAVGIAGK